MKAYFKKLYQYNQWANLGLCEHLKVIRELPDDIMMRLSHVVAAEEIWYHRIEPLEMEPLPVFEIQSWEVLEPRLTLSAKRWLDLVTATDDFERKLIYKNLAGKTYESNLGDIFMHVANHGTYHRGQIATLLRQQQFEPLPTDFILFTRV